MNHKKFIITNFNFIIAKLVAPILIMLVGISFFSCSKSKLSTEEQYSIDYQNITESEFNTIEALTSSLPAIEAEQLSARLIKRMISWNHNWGWWYLCLIPIWLIIIAIGGGFRELDEISFGKYSPKQIWLAWFFVGFIGLHRLLMKRLIIFSIGIITFCISLIGLLKPLIIYYPALINVKNLYIVFCYNWGAWLLVLCLVIWLIDIYFNLRYTHHYNNYDAIHAADWTTYQNKALKHLGYMLSLPSDDIQIGNNISIHRVKLLKDTFELSKGEKIIYYKRSYRSNRNVEFIITDLGIYYRFGDEFHSLDWEQIHKVSSSSKNRCKYADFKNNKEEVILSLPIEDLFGMDHYYMSLNRFSKLYKSPRLILFKEIDYYLNKKRDLNKAHRKCLDFFELYDTSYYDLLSIADDLLIPYVISCHEKNSEPPRWIWNILEELTKHLKDIFIENSRSDGRLNIVNAVLAASFYEDDEAAMKFVRKALECNDSDIRYTARLMEEEYQKFQNE